MFETIRDAIAAAAAGAHREMSRSRDFTAAARFVASLAKHGKLTEAELLGFARERKYPETIAALAELSASSIEVIRPVMQSLRDDGVLIPCRVAGLKWETVAAILDSRFASGTMARDELARAKAQYAKLTLENARRLIRFWQVRPVAPVAKAN
jgi:hypothetical protein